MDNEQFYSDRPGVLNHFELKASLTGLKLLLIEQHPIKKTNMYYSAYFLAEARQ